MTPRKAWLIAIGASALFFLLFASALYGKVKYEEGLLRDCGERRCPAPSIPWYDWSDNLCLCVMRAPEK